MLIHHGFISDAPLAYWRPFVAARATTPASLVMTDHPYPFVQLPFVLIPDSLHLPSSPCYLYHRRRNLRPAISIIGGGIFALLSPSSEKECRGGEKEGVEGERADDSSGIVEISQFRIIRSICSLKSAMPLEPVPSVLIEKERQLT